MSEAGAGPRPERIEPEPETFDLEEVRAKGADALLEEGAQLFDAGRYHEAHEVFEQLWLASEAGDADFWKGLIQASICLYHASRGNVDGARALLRGHRALLARFLPEHRGVDVAALLAEMQAYLAPLRSPEPDLGTLDPALRPRLRRRPAGD